MLPPLLRPRALIAVLTEEFSMSTCWEACGKLPNDHVITALMYCVIGNEEDGSVRWLQQRHGSCCQDSCCAISSLRSLRRVPALPCDPLSQRNTAPCLRRLSTPLVSLLLAVPAQHSVAGAVAGQWDSVCLSGERWQAGVIYNSA